MSEWHSEMACRALRTAARGRLPGLRTIDPRTLRTNDFFAGEFTGAF
jgi:hypothetical protein